MPSKPIRRRVKVKKRSALSSVPANIVSGLRSIAESEAERDSVSDSLYWSGGPIDSGHSKHRVLFHLVFIPKYRRRVLEGELARRVRSLFEQACDVKGWRIAGGFMS